MAWQIALRVLEPKLPVLRRRARAITNWHCELSKAGLAVAFFDDFCVGWHFVRAAKNRWSGTSFESAPRTTLTWRIERAPVLAASLRPLSPMPGRYSGAAGAEC